MKATMPVEQGTTASTRSTRAERIFFAGIGLLLLIIGPILWEYSSRNASVFHRYSLPYALFLVAEGGAAVAALVLASLPSRSAANFYGSLRRRALPPFQRRWSLALFLTGLWAAFCFFLFLLAKTAFGRSSLLHFLCLWGALWVSFGCLLFSRPDTRSRARSLAKHIICLGVACIGLLLTEMVLRKNPGLLPARLRLELPGGGDFLHSEYIFDSPATVGYRFRPKITISEQLKASAANLYLQEPSLVRPMAKGQERVLLEATFTTDENGYRNDSPLKATYPIVVSGDSFTLLPAEPRPWPTILAEKLGVPILNLGMPGYSPQSEAEALRAFGLPRKPRWIVLAYFEGNDLVDSYYYEAKMRSGMGWIEYDLAESGYLERYLTFDLFCEGLRTLVPGWRKAVASAGDFPYPFTAQLNGRDVEMSLSTSYLSRLALSRAEVESINSFQPIIGTLKRLETAAAASGARLLVVYCPTKEHCYLPLLPVTLVSQKLGGARRASVSAEGSLVSGAHPLKPAELLLNLDGQRLAIVEGLEQEGIEVLDLTPRFQESARQGETLYLTNDTHWSRPGNDLAASAMAERLREGL